MLLTMFVGVVVPVTYLYYSTHLPPLESEYDLESLLRGYVEGERFNEQSAQAGLRGTQTRWPRPAVDRLPRDLVDLFLSEMGCPTFFQTPRESSRQAAWRAFNMFTQGSALSGADGRCEFQLGMRIADQAHIQVDATAAIAAFRIRTFLTKDQLVAYALESYRAEPGVFGVEQAARVLYQKGVKELPLSQLAELMLAVPPNDFYQDLRVCRNPLLIRQGRDVILSRASTTGLVTPERVRVAKAQPIGCKS